MTRTVEEIKKIVSMDQLNKDFVLYMAFHDVYPSNDIKDFESFLRWYTEVYEEPRKMQEV